MADSYDIEILTEEITELAEALDSANYDLEQAKARIDELETALLQIADDARRVV